jgi:hypothetical protein
MTSAVKPIRFAAENSNAANLIGLVKNILPMPQQQTRYTQCLCMLAQAGLCRLL